ncbi:MAG: stalk domain-containing protein [Aminipila sp.]
MKKILKRIFTITLIVTLTLTYSGSITAFAAESKGIKVQYNGENINLTAADVKVVGGRTVVSFRQTLEAMGATVSYDAKTKLITAKTSNKEISFAVGGKDITINEGGKKVTKKMDVAPFVDKKLNRTYVPVRFIAESMGYNVGWDEAEKTAIIINPADIYANVDKDFSIVSKLLKSDLDLEKPYETNGKFSCDVITHNAPNTTGPAMNFSVSGEMSGVQQKLNSDLTMKLTVNMDNMLTTLPAEQKAALQPMLENFKNANMNVKLNGETGNTYMQSGLFSALDPTANKNTWYKMNIYDQYEAMGIDLKSIMSLQSNKMKLSDLIKIMSSVEYSDVSSYKDMKTSYTFLKYLIGDEAFTTKTSGDINTYTLDINQASIMAALAKTAIAEGVTKDSLDVKDLEKFLKESSLNGSLTIQDKSGSLYGYSIKGSGAIEKKGSFAMNITGDQKNAVIDMTLDMDQVMKMAMKAESHVSETTKTPNVEIPAGAKVVEMPLQKPGL